MAATFLWRLTVKTSAAALLLSQCDRAEELRRRGSTEEGGRYRRQGEGRLPHSLRLHARDVVKTLVGGRRRSALEELTDRERDVLSLIAEGRSNRAIGKQLFLSSRAVERNVQTIFRKLGLRDTEDDNRRVLAVLALLGN